MQKVLYKKDKDTPFELGYFVGFIGTGSDAQAVIAQTDGRPVMIPAENFEYDLRFVTPDLYAAHGSERTPKRRAYTQWFIHPRQGCVNW